MSPLHGRLRRPRSFQHSEGLESHHDIRRNHEGDDDNDSHDSSIAMDDFLISRIQKAQDSAVQKTELGETSTHSLPNLHYGESSVVEFQTPAQAQHAGQRTSPPPSPRKDRVVSPPTLISTTHYNPFSPPSPILRDSHRTPQPLQQPQLSTTHYTPFSSPWQASKPRYTTLSDEALEAYATKMRSELRYMEMVEMASEAERAAEAGEESFAAKPSTYGKDDIAVKKPPSVSKRSISEGAKAPVVATPKLVVTSLRDVHEVFPSFSQFHGHLRTHFVREGTTKKTLHFKERSKSPLPGDMPHATLKPRDRQQTPLPFLKNLDVKEWVVKGGLVPGLKASEDKSSVGDRLSDHICQNSRNVKPPRVPVPPGMVDREYKSESTVETASLTAVESSDMERSYLPRRALMDVELTPVRGMDPPAAENLGHRGDFVTPARLRSIRRVKQTTDLPDHMMLPHANSVLDSDAIMLPVRQLQQPLVEIEEALRESDSRDSSVLMPKQLTREFENLNKSKSADSSTNKSYDSVGLNTNSYMDVDRTPPLTPLQDQSTSYESELTPSRQPTLRSSSRNVRVSIFGSKSADGDDRRDSISQSEVFYMADESGVLAADDGVATSGLTDSIRTPQQDCGCLSLSPDTSFDSDAKPPMIPDDPKQNKVNSLQTAFKVFTRLSPSRNMFRTKRKASKTKRIVYYRSADNDAFLKNYLYCSKPEGEVAERGPKENLCALPCENNVESCGDPWDPQVLCSGLLIDSAPETTRRPQQDFVSLGGDARTEADSWFDMATEGFDSVLERWTGSGQKQLSPWNISFQAPTLKKSTPGFCSPTESFTSTLNDGRKLIVP